MWLLVPLGVIEGDVEQWLGIYFKCNLNVHDEIVGWHTSMYKINPSYFSFLVCDLFIFSNYKNNILKMNSTNENLLWL